MKRSVIIESVCFLLIFLFIYTGLSKLFDHAVFQRELAGLRLIGSAATVLSYLLPLSEIIIALMLLVPKLRSYGLYASFFLLAVFTLYLSVSVASGTKLPCSCGGVIQYLSWKQHIAFNLFFIMMAVIGIYLQNRSGMKSSAKKSRTTNN